MGRYDDVYRRSLADPAGFWAEAAGAIRWRRQWNRVLDPSSPKHPRWFDGGELNTADNAVDAHVDRGGGESESEGGGGGGLRGGEGGGGGGSRTRSHRGRGDRRRAARRVRDGGRRRSTLRPLHERHHRPAQGNRARQRRPRGGAEVEHEEPLRREPRRTLLGGERHRLGGRAVVHRLCAAPARL